MENKPHAPTGDEIAKALNHEIERFELKVESDEYRTYTTLEVLALLYAIRDCEQKKPRFMVQAF